MTNKNAFNFFKNRTAMTTPTHGLEVNSPSMSTSLSAAERRSNNTGANLNVFKTHAIAAFALILSAFVFNANAAVNIASTAGSVLREVQPSDGFAPLTSESELSVESQDNVGSAQSAPFLVKVIEITGNTLFSTDTLTALVADAQGQSLTLAELSAAVARITDYYRSQGYPLARAIIPAQEITDGVVRIDVLEARFGTITLINTSSVDTPLLKATIASLLSGQVIGQAALDETLLQLSDIPGIVSAMTLKPGQLAGTSDLLVTTAPGPAVSGNITVDNNGNAYTGQARVGAALNVINPFNSGDVLSINALTAGSGMDYGRISYEALVSGRGTRLGGAYSALNYKLGAPSTIGYGSAQVQSLWARHPLLRTRPLHLYGQVQFDKLQLSDISDSDIARHLDNLSITVSGQSRNTFSRNSVNAFSLGWTAGQVSFDNAAALTSDATAKTQGRFSKLQLKLTHLQTLTARNGLYLSVDGQWASTNLDTSQKMGTGGPHTVRGYDTGTLSGDEGTMVTAEWRYKLGSTMGGQWQGVVFADSARVTVNKNTLNPGTTNTATLSGAGLGLKWVGNNKWSASVYIAQPIGSKPELVTSRDATRAWVELKRGF
jgi:hemolysin activation/secretion protein